MTSERAHVGMKISVLHGAPGFGVALARTDIAIEQGKYSPSLEIAFRIALAFGVPLEQVFQYRAG
jgi:hypothetical protein